MHNAPQLPNIPRAEMEFSNQVIQALKLNFCGTTQLLCFFTSFHSRPIIKQIQKPWTTPSLTFIETGVMDSGVVASRYATPTRRLVYFSPR